MNLSTTTRASIASMLFSMTACMALGCTSEGAPHSPGGDPGRGDAGSNGSGARWEIFGTTLAAPSTFVVYDTECTSDISLESPGLAIADVHLPADWKVVGVSSGGEVGYHGSGSMRVTNDAAQRSLQVGTVSSRMPDATRCSPRP